MFNLQKVKKHYERNKGLHGQAEFTYKRIVDDVVKKRFRKSKALELLTDTSVNILKDYYNVNYHGPKEFNDLVRKQDIVAVSHYLYDIFFKKLQKGDYKELIPEGYSFDDVEDVIENFVKREEFNMFLDEVSSAFSVKSLLRERNVTFDYLLKKVGQGLENAGDYLEKRRLSKQDREIMKIYFAKFPTQIRDFGLPSITKTKDKKNKEKYTLVYPRQMSDGKIFLFLIIAQDKDNHKAKYIVSDEKDKDFSKAKPYKGVVTFSNVKRAVEKVFDDVN